jgi:hypothetical protein
VETVYVSNGLIWNSKLFNSTLLYMKFMDQMAGLTRRQAAGASLEPITSMGLGFSEFKKVFDRDYR